MASITQQAAEEFLQKLLAEMSPGDEQFMMQLLAQNKPAAGPCIEAASAIEYKYFPIEQISAQVYIPRWQPNKKRQTWPTEEDFNQQSEILKWRDLPKGIYKIHGHKEKQNNFGGFLILHLSTRENADVFDVWAPQRLADKILEEHYHFVFNEGLAKSTKTGYFYFKFSLL